MMGLEAGIYWMEPARDTCPADADEARGGSLAPSQAGALCRALVEIVRFGANPDNEFRECRVGTQRLGRVVVAREFRFGQQAVDLSMADSVQVGRDRATLGARHEVVGIFLGVRNFAFAQRTQPRQCGRGQGRCGQLFATNPACHEAIFREKQWTSNSKHAT